MHIIKSVSLIALVVVWFLMVFSIFSSYGSSSFTTTSVEMNGGLIKVYIVDLDGVGGFRAVNHSAVVEGAKQVTFINFKHELLFWFYFSDWLVPDYEVNVHVNASYELVHNWQIYKQLVEDANNTIIVNTHDEILPIPNDYTKESWTTVIADFMLNRWGTWVHTGGLPFRIVQYENGTTEEWNEGFKTLMEQANQNITIKNPQKNSDEPDKFQIAIEMGYGHTMEYLGSFTVHLGEDADPLTKFWYAVVDYANGFDCCLKYDQNNIDTSIIHIYSFNSTVDLNVYAASAALRVSNNTNKYGIFVYSSPWRFEDGDGNYLSEHNSNIGMGAIPTAAAIWCEAGYAARKIVEATAANSKVASLLQKANELFDAGNYKQAVIYVEKVTVSRQPDIIPVVILTTVGIIAITTIAVINRNNQKILRKN